MGVHKGTDNFKHARKKAIDNNIDLIKRALKKLQQRKLKFPDYITLRDVVSDKTTIHRTTFERNATYSKLLLDFLAEQAGASVYLAEKDAPREVLLAKINDLKLILSNCQQQLEIAVKRLEKIEAERANKGETAQPMQLVPIPDSPTADAVMSDQEDWYQAFVSTAMLLIQVMERLNEDGAEMLQLAPDGRFLDLSAPKHMRVIAGKQRTKWFMEIYEKLKQQGAGTTWEDGNE